MTTTWAEVKLGAVCNILPGFAFKSKDWSEEGIAVLKIKNITSNNTVNLSDVDHVPQELLTPQLEKFLLKNGDIVLAMTGATAGKVGQLRTSAKVLLNQRVAKIDPIHADRDFIWAVVSSQEYQRRFFHLADGAAQPNMSGAQIEGVTLRLPTNGEQKRIGQIIAAYDDLIEVNRQRIALLEDMARRLFEEWFVRFRYPGHERYAMIETPEGPLPEGWRRKELGEMCADIREAVSPIDVEGDTPYVGLEHIPRRSTTLGAWGRADEVTSTKLKFQAGDILFGKIRPYFHKVVFAPFEGVSSSDAIVIRSRLPELNGLVLSVTSSDQFVAHAVATSNGTKMPRANWAVLAHTPVPLPPNKLMKSFNDAVVSWAKLAASLNRATTQLATSRDLLLPRLISGELSVPSAERELEAVA